MRPLLVAATRQHVGKTTVSLSIMSGLKKRFGATGVGFMKPVGQEHVCHRDSRTISARASRTISAGHHFMLLWPRVEPALDQVVVPGSGTSSSPPTHVDKDVELMREFFRLYHIAYQDMSPVLIPKSYTQRFIDGKITSDMQADAILESYRNVSAVSDFVLLEGTGHVGVGSIVNMSNAAVAKLLGADVLLVCNGGLGSAFDELEMNRALCNEHGVRVRGVLLNKVRHDKVDMVRDYMGRVLKERWGVPLVGVVPDLPFLSKASLADIEELLGAQLVAGHKYRNLHYGYHNVDMVTTSLRRHARTAQFTRSAWFLWARRAITTST